VSRGRHYLHFRRHVAAVVLMAIVAAATNATIGGKGRRRHW